MKELNEALAQRVLDVVDKGLVRGVGKPTPGSMCVEAAVCFAMGLPHGDNPSCVGRALRRFKIRLNDSGWSSDAARAKGMRKLAVAQLGSDTIDQAAFAKILIDQTIRIIIPRVLRSAAKVNRKHASRLEAAAVRCEVEGTRESARLARAAAGYAAADAAGYAAGYAADAAADAAAGYAAADAAGYAADAADAAADAAGYAAADAAGYAADAADAAAADAAGYAADAAAAAAAAADAAYDSELTAMADIGLAALIQLRSPGCAFLHLCEA